MLLINLLPRKCKVTGKQHELYIAFIMYTALCKLIENMKKLVHHPTKKMPVQERKPDLHYPDQYYYTDYCLYQKRKLHKLIP